MMQLMDYCLSNGIEPTMKAWCDRVGVNSTSISNIRKGTQQFTACHIDNACREYNISPNFIFGYSDAMLRYNKNTSPFEVIRAALSEIERTTPKQRKSKK